MSPVPNEQMVAFWNASGAERWVRHQDQLDAQLAPFSELVLDAVGLSAGESVIDVGCGCGSLALDAARRVQPGGRVLGIDVSAPMLERAGQRAREAGIEGIELVLADAQVHELELASFDALVSRFGVMFFDDPRAAFARLRSGLRPGGRLAFSCFQEMAKNTWATLPLSVVTGLGAVLPEREPDAPGPFGFANPERVRRVLGQAGFQQIVLESIDQEMPIGRELDAAGAAAFLTELGPAAALLREQPELYDAARAELEQLLRNYEKPSEGVRLRYSVWLVTARA